MPESTDHPHLTDDEKHLASLGYKQELERSWAGFINFAGVLPDVHIFKFNKDGKIDAAPMVTGTVGLDGVAAAFTALGDPERHAKILIDPRSAAVDV